MKILNKIVGIAVKTLTARLDLAPPPADRVCFDCPRRESCGACPGEDCAIHYLEVGRAWIARRAERYRPEL